MCKNIIFVIVVCISLSIFTVNAQKITILATNDTHSQIDADEEGCAGVLQRKVVIDSVRRIDKNVILVDAGDAVQGSLYFRYYKGDVEFPIMDIMGYDIRIFGNHEFDNGIESLVKYGKYIKGKFTSANYDFSNTALANLVAPYIIKNIAGKRIGFFGLNVNPKSLILEKNIRGLKFTEILQCANRVAALLRNQKHCDLIVAVTHIGYDEKEETGDRQLAMQSRDIDIIIGGHSHTLITPPADNGHPIGVENANGRKVLITQAGKTGKYIAEIVVDFSNTRKGSRVSPDAISYSLIPITNRFNPSQFDKKIIEFLAPYKAVVDSVNANVIGYAPHTMTPTDTGRYCNWAADMVLQSVQQQLDSIHRVMPKSTLPVSPDLAIINKGGIRLNMPKGEVTEGRIISTFPFYNYLTLLEVKGRDLIATFQIMAAHRGECISNNVRIATDENWRYINATINGYSIDPEKTYIVATIDFLAEGKDDMTPLRNSNVLWSDYRDLAVVAVQYVRTLTTLNMPMVSDPLSRFQKAVHIKLAK